MAKGSTGTNTSMIIRTKKPDRIKCDCSRCYHSKRGAGTIYCVYYDIISPKRTTCARYWCVKPAPKDKKNQNVRRKSKPKRPKED